MKQPLLLFILALATFAYFYQSPSVARKQAENDSLQSSRSSVASHEVIVARSPSSYNRWKTGPNAQTEFEPFAPSEQANWNQSPGYTIVAGAGIRR
jgi:hypothetical protein